MRYSYNEKFKTLKKQKKRLEEENPLHLWIGRINIVKLSTLPEATT